MVDQVQLHEILILMLLHESQGELYEWPGGIGKEGVVVIGIVIVGGIIVVDSR